MKKVNCCRECIINKWICIAVVVKAYFDRSVKALSVGYEAPFADVAQYIAMFIF